MAEQSTGVKYAISIDDTELRKAAQESAKAFDDIASKAVQSGNKMDSIFDKAAASAAGAVDDFASLSEQIRFQKDIIAGLEKDLKVLEDAYKNAAPGKEWADAVGKFNAAKAELQGEKQALEEMEAQANKTANSQVSMRTRMREVREELIALESAGKRGTEEYRKLQEEAGRLQDAYADASAQMRIMAHDQRGMQGIISGLTGLSAAFSAASGVVGLFTKDNEKLQQAMLRVQSLMSITVGLQQIQQTLNKDSAFRLVIINGIKEWWVKTTQKATVAMAAETAAVKAGGTAATGAAGAFRLLGAAIKSIPGVGWLIAALTAAAAAVAVITKRLKGQAEELKKSREEAAELKKMVNESAAKSVSGIMELSRSYKRLGDDMQAKQRFIEENKRAFDDLGVSVASVADAENLLINNTDKFIEAEKARAVAVALRERAQKIIAENLDVLMFDTNNVKQPDVSYQDNSQYAEYIKKNTETLNKGLSYRKKTVENQLDELYKMISDKDSEFNKIMSGFHTNAASNVTANVSNDIEAAKKAYEDGKKKIKDYEAELNSKLTENDILLERDATQRRIKEINLREERELNALKELGEKVLAQERENAKNRALITEEAYNESAVTLPEGFEQMLDAVTAQVKQEAKKQRDAVAAEARRAYDELAEEYASLEGKIAAIKAKYAKQTETAGSDTSLTNKIYSRQQQEIAALILDSFKAEEAIGKVAEQVQSLGKAARSALQNNLQKIVDFVAKKRNFGFIDKQDIADFAALNGVSEEFLQSLIDSDEAFEKFMQYVRDMSKETAEPIDNIAKAIKNFKKAKEAAKSDDIIDIDNLEIAQQLLEDMTKQLADNILSTADALAQMFREIADMTGNDALAKVGDVMSDIVGNIQAAEAGAQAWGGWWGAIIGGLVDMIPKIIKWVNLGNAESLESIEKQLSSTEQMLAYWKQIYEYGSQWTAPEIGSIGIQLADLYAQLEKAEKAYNRAVTWAQGKSGERKVAQLRKRRDDLLAEIEELENRLSNASAPTREEAYNNTLSNYDKRIEELQQRITALKKHARKNIDEIKAAYIELAQAIQDRNDFIRQDLEDTLGFTATSLASQISDALASAFDSGSDAAKAFGNTVSDVMRNVVKNIVMTRVIEDKLNEMFNEMADINWKNADPDMAKADYIFKWLHDNLEPMIEGMGEKWEEAARKFGWDTTTAATGATKGVATASQDSVDELNGRMTVIQEHTASLVQSSALSAANTTAMLSALNGIHSDTSQMRTDLNAMRADLNAIRYQ